MGGSGGGFLIVPALSGSSGRPKISVGPIPAASSPATINLPLNTYASVSTLQQTVLTEADTLLEQQCMTDKGFVYSAQADPTQQAGLIQDTEYGFGVTAAADASRYGYGQPGAGGQRGGIAFLGGFASFGDLAKQPRAWTVALLGFAPGAPIGRLRPEGCLQVASQELYGQGGGLSDPVPSIAIQASTWTQSDPRVQAVDAAWSRCMARRGYTYSNPDQAANAHWPSKPSTVETATALADVACKQQVNLPNTWLAVEAAYQTALVGQDLSTLANLQASFQRMLTRAQTLLSGAILAAPGQAPLARLAPAPIQVPASSQGH